jgi:hypothetical protein
MNRSLGTGFKISRSALQPLPLAVSAAYLYVKLLLELLLTVSGEAAMSARQVIGLVVKMRTPVAVMRLRSSLWKRLQEEGTRRSWDLISTAEPWMMSAGCSVGCLRQV